MLSFATPWALGAAALAVWLLWRARRPRSPRTHTVSNLFLWRDGQSRAAIGAPDRPRPPWLVWIQALALAALAVAASGPARPSPLADAALVIDISRSMGAREATGTRIDLARAAARTWLNQRPAGARIALVAAGEPARMVGVFRANDPSMTSALNALAPVGTSADFTGAFETAQATTEGPIATIADAPAPLGADRAGEWLRVGTPSDNVGIVSLGSGGDGRALVEVQNFGAAARRASLTLANNQRALWRRDFLLTAGASRAFLPVIPSGTTAVTAQLHVDDPAGNALAADDTLTADVSPRTRVPVLLVTRGNRFLEAALRALPETALTVASALPADVPAGTVIICDACAVAARRPSLWLPPATSTSRDDATVAITRADHALLRGVDFSDVRVTPTEVAVDALSVLARAAGRPVIAADETRDGRHVTLAVDLSTSPWPITVAFPVFVANAVDWLADRAPVELSAATVDSIGESDLRQPPPASLEAESVETVRVASSWRTAIAGIALLLVALEWLWRRQRPWARTVAVIAIAAAIAGARMPGCAAGRTVMFAVDGSGSVAAVRGAALDRVRAEMAAMSPDDRAGLVVFGASGNRLRRPDASRSIDDITLPPASASTNLAAGVQSSRSSLPDQGDRRIVLLTDGQPTVGDALPAAESAHVPIDVVPLDDHASIVVRRLDAPVESRAGVAISLRAEIDGAPGTRIAIDFLRDGAAIGTRPVTLDTSGHASAVWSDTPTHSGVVFYHAAAQDPRLGVAVSDAGAGVTIGGRTRVLLVSDRPGDVASRLRAPEVEIDTRTVTTTPDTRTGLTPYSAIVLDALAPHRLNARQLDAISDAIALDGAGLLVLGDRDSLSAAEYPPSRFADSLPIDFTTMPRPPSTSMALALLVDTSGSMATTSDGVTKIAAARDAVSRALAVLPAGDAVQVIGFSAVPTVVMSAGDSRDPASVAERLRALSPNGGTALTPALTHAMAWLRSVPNPIRRVLLISDGRTAPADGDAARAAVAGQGIEVSVVAIGGDADQTWLSGLAKSTGGRAYFPETLRALPRDVAREAARGVSGREIDERFRVRAGSHPLAPTSPPELGGYVAGQLRSGATAAWKSPTEDPVLAAWPHGLGRVVVFASDLRGPWGAPLASWRESSEFWRRTMTWLSRSNDVASADAQLETTTVGTRLIVETGAATDGDALRTISASILTPSGTTFAMPLHAVTSSRADAALPLSETGDYRATIVISDPRTGIDTRFMRGWYWSGDLEAQARGVNLPLLQRIAAVSGGAVHAAGPSSTPDAAVFGGPRTRTSRDAAVALLLLAALVLFWDYLTALAREAH